MRGVRELEVSIQNAKSVAYQKQRQAQYIQGEVVSKMASVRADADWMEMNVDKKQWPLCSYTDMLYYE